MANDTIRQAMAARRVGAFPDAVAVPVRGMAPPAMAQPFPATEAFPGKPQPTVGTAPAATTVGVDQNGRSLAFPDAGPNVSGARVVTPFQSTGTTIATTTTTIAQARAAARARSAK
jgi:hypothetical protein